MFVSAIYLLMLHLGPLNPDLQIHLNLKNGLFMHFKVLAALQGFFFQQIS